MFFRIDCERRSSAPLGNYCYCTETSLLVLIQHFQITGEMYFCRGWVHAHTHTHTQIASCFMFSLHSLTLTTSHSWKHFIYPFPISDTNIYQTIKQKGYVPSSSVWLWMLKSSSTADKKPDLPAGPHQEVNTARIPN